MGRTGNSEKSNVDQIRALQKAVAANKRCADCKDFGPTYICLDFWTYVCQTCSGVHRSFGHRIKSISLSDWTSSEVQKISCGGNERAAQTWFAQLGPDDWPQVDATDAESVDKLRGFIKQAYVEKRWWKEPPATEETGSSLNGTGAPAPAAAPAVAPAAKSVAVPAAPAAKPAATAVAPDAAAVLHHDGKPVTTITLTANGAPATTAASPNYIPLQTGQARFCKNHNTSEKRVKQEPMLRQCIGCHVQLHTNYGEFSFCPTCSSQKEACMICGADAEVAAAAPKAVPKTAAAPPSAQGVLPVWSADFGSNDTSDKQLSAEQSGTATLAAAADVGRAAANGSAPLSQAAAPINAQASSMNLLDLDFSDPVLSSAPVLEAAPVPAIPAPATVNATPAVGADISANSQAPLELLAPTACTVDSSTAANGSTVAPPTVAAKAVGESSFFDLDGLAFDNAPAAPAAVAGDANSASLGDKLREALLSGGGDGVRSVFEAAAHAELEARTTTGDRLREALLKGSNDDVSRLFREFAPPDRAADANPFQGAYAQADPFQGAYGCAQADPFQGAFGCAQASPAVDLSRVGSGAAFDGNIAAGAPGLGRVSAQDLSLLGANELQGLQEMVAQAIQTKIAQDTVQKVGSLPPLGAAPLDPGVLEQAPASTKEAGQFTDPLLAFHEKHPINGLESANVT